MAVGRVVAAVDITCACAQGGATAPARIDYRARQSAALRALPPATPSLRQHMWAVLPSSASAAVSSRSGPRADPFGSHRHHRPGHRPARGVQRLTGQPLIVNPTKAEGGELPPLTPHAPPSSAPVTPHSSSSAASARPQPRPETREWERRSLFWGCSRASARCATLSMDAPLSSADTIALHSTDQRASLRPCCTEFGGVEKWRSRTAWLCMYKSRMRMWTIHN